jgi:hypothetical protein
MNFSEVEKTVHRYHDGAAPFPSCERDLRLRAFAGRLANSIIGDSRCSTSPSANALARRIEKEEQTTDDDPAKECPCVCKPRLTHQTNEAVAERVGFILR